MKKPLFILGYVLAAFVVLFTVLGFTAPKTFKMERSILIKTNLEPIFVYVRQLRNSPKWNAWLMKDPSAKIAYRGPEATVGSVMAWESENPEVGTAEQEILNIAAWEIVHTEIRFKKPFEAVINSYVTTDGTAPQETFVVMGMTGKMPFPMNVFSFVANTLLGQKEKTAADMDQSLKNLKQIIENNRRIENEKKATP